MAMHRRHRPDPSTAERLVAGRVDTDDAPPGYRRVATLLGDAGSGFPEPAGPAEAATVSAMVAAIHRQPAPQVASRRSSMLSKVLAAKTIAAVSFVALSASGAAAATGYLPDSVQDRVAGAAEHVGVHLPHGEGVERVTEGCVATEDGTSFARNRGQYLKQERAKGAEALAAAEKSRCGMPIQSKGTPGADEADETPQNPALSEDHGKVDADHGKADPDHGKADEDHGKVDADHGKADAEHGKADEDHGKADADHGKADEDHGAPADNPAAVDTPNTGGIDTGGTASDGANDTGAEHSDPAAGDGSANSDDHPTAEDHPKADDHPGGSS